MMIPSENLRLFLTFLDGLKRVQIFAATNQVGSRLRIMGVTEGEEQLQDLLGKVGIDHYIRCTGDLLKRTLEVTAVERTPELIVRDLEKRFERADEVPLKILQGSQLTDEERSFTVPASLTVCASSMKTDEGLRRIQAWFNAKRRRGKRRRA
jgi:hypothetical protein